MGTGSQLALALPRTVAEIEEAFVHCHELWRRSPGARVWPFAGDAPWHLMQGEAGDYAGDGADGVSSSLRPRTALDVAEVAERDAVTAWLQQLGDVVDRRIVWQATAALHRGEGRVPWTALAVWLGWSRTPRALAGRYRIVLATLVCGLHGWPVRRARELAARIEGES